MVLVSAQLLRSREYDADLRAAQLSGGPAAVSTLLTAFAPAPATRWFRRPLAKHPSHRQRVAVLERPAGAAPVTFLDGFAAAFLAALVVPLLVTLVIAATVGAVSTTVAEVTAALLVGALLGGSVGLAQWRACVIGRLDGVRLSPWPVACGVGAGLAAGEMASLGNVAFVSPLGDTPPEWYLVVGVAGLSCTLLGHAAGEVWADAVPKLPGARLVWVPALLVTGLLYTVLCWAGQALDLLLAGGGWSMVVLWLVAMPQRWLPALALVVLVAAVGYGLVAGRQTRHGAAVAAGGRRASELAAVRRRHRARCSARRWEPAWPVRPRSSASGCWPGRAAPTSRPWCGSSSTPPSPRPSAGWPRLGWRCCVPAPGWPSAWRCSRSPSSPRWPGSSR